jgi:DNA-binding GntR family transcriptional regulator
MPDVSLAQNAYEYLYDQILTGRFTDGTVLSEASLAKELGISRTPVGKAIQRLSEEGLLERVPRFGTVVRNFTRREVIEQYEMREALEAYAAARAAVKISVDALDRLERFCEDMDQLAQSLRDVKRPVLDKAAMKHFMATDLAFHLLIARTAGNVQLLHGVRRANTISGLFWIRRQEHTVERINQAAVAHRSIVDALRGVDGAEAGTRMVAHIAASQQHAMSYFDREEDADTQDPLATYLPEEFLSKLGPPSSASRA